MANKTAKAPAAPQPWAMNEHAASAHQYALDVISEEIPAGKLTILAAKRYFSELERAESSENDDFPYIYDPAKAARPCRFIELLPHTKGKWAAKKETLKLEPWQLFFICNVFGWVHRDTGLRRFSQAYLRVARKNGKSAISAGIGLYMLCADNEFGAEVYSGATSEKQALEVFIPAKLMANRTPALCSKYGLTVNASNLHIMAKGSKFEPVIGKPGDGASPSCAIVDEYHEHDTDDLVNTMVTGMGARDQALLLIITTAGDNIGGPCYILDKECEEMLTGVVERDHVFAQIYHSDEDDEWNSEIAMLKANPNYGVSVMIPYLQRQLADAMASPRKLATFKTKHLNQWVQAGSPLFDRLKWNALADMSLDMDELVNDGWDAYLGVDMSTKKDLTAIVVVMVKEAENGKRHWRVFPLLFTPHATTIEGPNAGAYAEWIEDGWLQEMDGDTIDEAEIREVVAELAERVNARDVGYDPWQCRANAQWWQDEKGMLVTEVPQTARNLSEPTKEIDAAILDGRILHDGNPCMSWCVGNVVGKEDVAENVLPQKEKGRPFAKIDGAAAMVTAIARALTNDAPSMKSRYENTDERPAGLLVLGA
jgi:phage terminase large subunit-like protein